ncbi:hypothetical protein [Methylobacterium sp. WL120]|uniref:hypothetical protein n=1 Tax=Methylobacterium sp. WL120 TaxID=2603887 RepID=UPI00164F31FC|nr:hypothetical protein [Methylobacterium sp. WL120]
MKVAVPGIGPRHMLAVAGPKGDTLGHARILDEYPLDVDDGSGPYEPISQAVVVVAPNEVDASVEANLDRAGVVPMRSGIDWRPEA